MNWDPEKIRVLRRRLGWSQSDLARRLHCESTLVIEWEHGQGLPAEVHIQVLDLIERQAEAQADELSQCPLAETLLDENALEQVDLESVKRRFTENN